MCVGIALRLLQDRGAFLLGGYIEASLGQLRLIRNNCFLLYIGIICRVYSRRRSSGREAAPRQKADEHKGGHDDLQNVHLVDLPANKVVFKSRRQCETELLFLAQTSMSA